MNALDFSSPAYSMIPLPHGRFAHFRSNKSSPEPCYSKPSHLCNSLRPLKRRARKISNSTCNISGLHEAGWSFSRNFDYFHQQKAVRWQSKLFSAQKKIPNTLYPIYIASSPPSGFEGVVERTYFLKRRRRQWKAYGGNDDSVMNNISKVKPFFGDYISSFDPTSEISDSDSARSDSDEERISLKDQDVKISNSEPLNHASSTKYYYTNDNRSFGDNSSPSSKDVNSFESSVELGPNSSPESESGFSLVKDYGTNRDVSDVSEYSGKENEGSEKLSYENKQNNENNSAFSNIGGLTGVYLRTKNLLSSLTSGVMALDEGIVRREKELHVSSKQIDEMLSSVSSENIPGNSSRDAVKRFRKLLLEFQELQRQAALKDKTIESLKKEGEITLQKLRVAEEAAGEAEFLKKEIEIRHEEKMSLQEELNKAENRGKNLTKEIETLMYDMKERDKIIQQLQEEANLSSSALQQAAKAMVAARDRTLRMEEQLERTGDLLAKERINSGKIKEKLIDSSADLAEAKEAMKNLTMKIEVLEKESQEKEVLLEKAKSDAENTTKLLEITTSSLNKAQSEIQALKSNLQIDGTLMDSQTWISMSALQSMTSQEQLLKASDAKIKEMSSELSTLKSLLSSNEETIKEIKKESLRNADLLLENANTKQELVSAQTTISQLEGQIEILEKELNQQNSLLSEIKGQNAKTTEILRNAANYKKELNEAREREAELMDKLLEKDVMIEDLKQELTRTSFSSSNDSVLRQLETRAEESEKEVISLRKGIMARDTALNLMKQQLQKTANIISSASKTKETLKQFQNQIEDLNEELREKDERLYMLEEELAKQSIIKQTRSKFSSNDDLYSNRDDDLDNQQGNFNTFCLLFSIAWFIGIPLTMHSSTYLFPDSYLFVFQNPWIVKIPMELFE